MRPEEIKALQQRLIARGLLPKGSDDGILGPATQRAMVLEQQMEPQQSDAEIQLERDRIAAEQAERDAARQERERNQQQQQQQQREQAVDPVWDTFAPFGAGAVVGGAYGELANRGLDRFERGNVAALKEIGDEIGPTRDLTSSQANRAKAFGAAQAAERFAPTNRLMQAGNVMGRAASYGIPAGLVFNEYQNYQGRANDEALTETERQANQRVANALLGTGTGIGVEGGRRFFFPAREPGMGQALARINAAKELATRMDASEARPRTPPAPAQPKPETPKASPKSRPRLPGSYGDLMQQAKRYNIQGRSKMNVEQLRQAVADAVKSTPAPRGGAATKLLKSPAFAPIVAGMLAYNMADAQAEDGSGPSTTDKLGTAGAAAATAYGGNRLLQAIPQMAKTAFSAGGTMLAPQMGADMTDYAPEELNTARNWAARNLPEFAQVGAVGEARDMAQVPERNPARVYENAYQPGGGEQVDDFDAEIAELQRLLSEMDGGGQQQPMPQPQFRPPAPSYAPQNRLLAVR